MTKTIKKILILDAACRLVENEPWTDIDEQALKTLQAACDRMLEDEKRKRDFGSFERLQKEAVADLDKNPRLFGVSLDPLLQE
jgi:hypothetical protein